MTTRPSARRHHFVPQGYLGSFTETGSKVGQFFVQEMNTGRWFKTTPQNVALQRDFNRIDSDTHPHDAIEKALSEFEGDVAEAIKRVLISNSFPVPEDLNLILNLVALLAARNPKMRDSFNLARAAVIERVSDLLVSDRGIWESHVRKMRATGEDVPDSFTFETAREFVNRAEYTVEFSTGSSLRVEFAAMDKLLTVLGERTWTLMLSPDIGPEFICCDHPVTLFWKQGRAGPVGYGLRQTEVFFPLGPNAALYGTYEDPLPEILALDAEGVAVMNARVAACAQRHLFSRLSAFTIKRAGSVRTINVEISA